MEWDWGRDRGFLSQHKPCQTGRPYSCAFYVLIVHSFRSEAVISLSSFSWIKMAECACVWLRLVFLNTNTVTGKTIDQPYISGLYLLITHGRSSGPQVNFDKWPVDCVESRKPARNSKYDLSSFLVLMRWFKHLRKVQNSAQPLLLNSDISVVKP